MRKAPLRRKLRGGFIPEGALPPINPTIPDEVLAQIKSGETTFIEVLKTKVPSMQDLHYWRVERERADAAAQKAKRMARRAAINDPEKRAREAKAFAEREARFEAARQAKAARLEQETAEKAAALEANPTANWRAPRRPDWQPPADYARGGRRQNKKRA